MNSPTNQETPERRFFIFMPHRGAYPLMKNALHAFGWKVDGSVAGYPLLTRSGMRSGAAAKAKVGRVSAGSRRLPAR